MSALPPLSDAQRNAVTRSEGDVCVVAGPGSGKTRVLIERFAWLVEHQNVDPRRILAITFTEKAANEIKTRLASRFSGSDSLREAVERAWVSTIHGFCAGLLKENAIAAGLSPDFSVLEQGASILLQHDAAEDVGQSVSPASEFLSLLAAIDTPDLADAIIDLYEAFRVSGSIWPEQPSTSSSWRESLRKIATEAFPSSAGHAEFREWARRFLSLGDSVSLDHFRVLTELKIHRGRLPKNSLARDFDRKLVEGELAGEWYANLTPLIRKLVERFDAAYRARKRDLQTLDFGDLEERAIRLLEENDETRTEISQRFDHVLMDELQDTNPLQWRLVNLVRRPGRFFAVGDINQSIYGFRHADPGVFTNFRASVAQPVELVENYRSIPEILEATSKILEAAEGIEPRRLRAVRESENQRVERICGDPAIVARAIRNAVDSGKWRYADIAILVRSLTSIDPIERALDELRIPYLVTGGRTFLEAREIRDLLHLLALLVNERDEIARAGVLRSPLISASDEAILRWKLDQTPVPELDDLLARLRPVADFVSPDLLLAQALDESGYWLRLAPQARANVDKFMDWLRRKHHAKPQALAEILAEFEALREAGSEAEAPPPEASDVVRLLSIHAAKGLEFPVVFICSIHRRPERRTPSLSLHPGRGLGVRWRNPITWEGIADPVHAAWIEDLRVREEAEENRLLYVAMTRAKDRLILQYEDTKQRGPWAKSVDASGLPLFEEQPQAISTAFSEPAAELTLTPPVVRGRYDSAASVTSVAMFRACPRRYYLERYLGLAPFAGDGAPMSNGYSSRAADQQSIGAAELGLQVHALLAGLRLRDPAPEALALIEAFRGSELNRRIAGATRLEQEFDFLMEIEDIVLAGQIDLWFEESGKLVIVDYKTDRDESGLDAYRLQLQLYALAIEKHTGRIPDLAVLYFLRSGHSVNVELTQESSNAARNAVKSFREAQERTHFPLIIADHCKSCAFWGNLCPAPVENPEGL